MGRILTGEFWARPKVEGTPRKRKLSQKQRVEILIDKPICYWCNKEFVDGDEVDFDHVIPLALGGLDDLVNMAPIHRSPCHKIKSVSDVKAIAKAKRIVAREEGTRRPRRPIPSRGFPNRRRPP